LFESADNQAPGSYPAVVLSYGFWKSRFAGRPDVIGQRITVNRYPMTILGVAGAGFSGVDIGENPAVWIPAAMTAQAAPGWDHLLDRRARWMHVFGRLRHGIAIDRAKAGLQPWFKSRLEEDSRLEGFPKVSAERRRQFFASTIDLIPAPQGRSDLRDWLRQPLWILLTATGVLLALACLNVAGLFLARAWARNRELATRMALGASATRIGRQLLAESALIAGAGGLLGAMVAPAIARSLIAFLPANTAELDLRPDLDWRLMLF